MRLAVEIWSDIACPWCYVDKRRFEAALAAFAHKDAVDVTWRAFELDPGAPKVQPREPSYAARLAAKYGMSEAKAVAAIDSMTKTAAVEGIEMHPETIQAGNTFDAHRLIHLAREHGKGDAAKERLFRAYFTEGQAVGDHAALAAVGAELGLDAAEVSALLDGDRFAREVRDEELEAQQLGIRGVPFFVIAGRYGVSGAQPADALRAALTQAWTELAPPPVAVVADGPTCGPDGC
ncbi:MAG: DsbA family oxidoreductase [Deltaproteobacteria bacterium]|nr:DsbA family oxidoreductase [Deltaproteobacteria bacterium]